VHSKQVEAPADYESAPELLVNVHYSNELCAFKFIAPLNSEAITKKHSTPLQEWKTFWATWIWHEGLTKIMKYLKQRHLIQ
jgi:hypothetical protein